MRISASPMDWLALSGCGAAEEPRPAPVYLACDRPSDGLCVEFVGGDWTEDEARPECDGADLGDEACSSLSRIGICHLDDGTETAVDWHYYRPAYYALSGLDLRGIWDACEADGGVWQTTI